MLSPVPSVKHRLELLALRAEIYRRSIWSRLLAHRTTLLVLSAIALVALVGIRYWHFWARVIPTKLAALARGILAFVQAHPRISHTFHVFVNMVPDIAYLLLALAGLSYLMPKVVKKIENSPPLRVMVITLFVCFGLLAVIVNAVNRTDQEEREGQLRDKLDKQGDKIDVVRDSLGKVQNFLVSSKGTPNEAERRKQVLEALRDQYVIDHPDVPVTMITGNSWPPKPWMDKRLQELGEKFPFISPPASAPPQILSTSPCTPGRPRTTDGPDAYKGVCDEDLAEWAIEEADTIANMADTCKRNVSPQGLAESGGSASEIQWRFDLDFKQCCVTFVKRLRNEALNRLGPLAVNSHEQDNWEFLFPEERSLPLGLKLKTELHQIGCMQVQDYAPYLRMLGRQVKRRITPRNPPKPLHFEETPLPPMAWPRLFGIEVTVDTSAPIVGGYVVAEFSGMPNTVGANFGRIFSGMSSDSIDNKPLLEYLAGLPRGSFTVELPENFFAPGKPIRITTYSLKEFHTVKVTLFDE